MGLSKYFKQKKAHVVFFVHFKSSNTESQRMELFYEEKNAEDFLNWTLEAKEVLSKLNNCDYVITNCGIIR